MTMRWPRRTDLFQVGDRVEFIDEDPYEGYGMEERHRSKHGRGPYTVEAVETHAPWMIDKYPHPQILEICGGHRYSGAWFKPLREAASEAA